MALSERERRFIEAYLGAAEGNATKAAVLAGYSEKSARRIGTRLSAKVHIQAAIAERQVKRADQADIDAVRVLKELARIGLSDPRELFTEQGELKPITEWSDDMARAVASVEVVKRPTGDKDTPYEDLHKIKLWDKNSALEKIAKHLGMFEERVIHSGKLVIEWQD